MLKFGLVTPIEIVCKEEVRMAVFPGAQGMLGVLENHAPMLVAVKEGRLDLYQTGSQVYRSFDVKEGYADITHDGCFLYVQVAKERV